MKKAKIIITVSAIAILALTVLIGQTTIFAQDEAPPALEGEEAPPALGEEPDEEPPGLGEDPDESPPGVDSPGFSEDEEEDDGSGGTNGGGVLLGRYDDDDDSEDEEENGGSSPTDYWTQTGQSDLDTDTIISDTGPEVGFLLIPSLTLGYLYRRKRDTSGL